jgi:hypothetical protein
MPGRSSRQRYGLRLGRYEWHATRRTAQYGVEVRRAYLRDGRPSLGAQANLALCYQAAVVSMLVNACSPLPLLPIFQARKML